MNGNDIESREEHLDWAKARALDFADRGKILEALTSLQSDLQKHSATRGHSAMQLGWQLYISGNMKTPEEARRWIEGVL